MASNSSVLISPGGPHQITRATEAATAWQRGLSWFAANTGLESGVSLTTNTTGMTVTVDNTVVENIDFTGGGGGYPVTPGQLRIWANNVTVRNCRFRGTPLDSGNPGPSIFVQGSAPANTLFEHCEFTLSPGYRGIELRDGATGTIIRYCKFSGGMEHIRTGSNTTVEDCYSHGLVVSGVGNHAENMMSDTGGGGISNVTVRRNWWNDDRTYVTDGAGVTSNINMTGPGPFSGWVMTDNYFTGSNTLLNTGQGPGTNVYTGNVFEDTGCPDYAGPTYPMNLPAGDTWTNNLLAPTMTTVPRPSI